MNVSRKLQIAWWASRIHEQAQEYADVADPKRTMKNATANKLDAIASLAKRIHFEITGKLPKNVAIAATQTNDPKPFEPVTHQELSILDVLQEAR